MLLVFLGFVTLVFVYLLQRFSGFAKLLFFSSRLAAPLNPFHQPIPLPPHTVPYETKYCNLLSTSPEIMTPLAISDGLLLATSACMSPEPFELELIGVHFRSYLKNAFGYRPSGYMLPSCDCCVSVCVSYMSKYMSN